MSYYLDKKYFNSEFLNQKADEFLKVIPNDVTHICSMDSFLPMLMALIIKSNSTTKPLKGFLVRLEDKQYGVKDRLIGSIPQEKDIILVIDRFENLALINKAIEDNNLYAEYIRTFYDK